MRWGEHGLCVRPSGQPTTSWVAADSCSNTPPPWVIPLLTLESRRRKPETRWIAAPPFRRDHRRYSFPGSAGTKSRKPSSHLGSQDLGPGNIEPFVLRSHQIVFESSPEMLVLAGEKLCFASWVMLPGQKSSASAFRSYGTTCRLGYMNGEVTTSQPTWVHHRVIGDITPPDHSFLATSRLGLAFCAIVSCTSNTEGSPCTPKFCRWRPLLPSQTPTV